MKIEPRVLENRWVRLEPFAPDMKEAVRNALNVDEAAWSIMVSTAHGEHFDAWWDGFTDQDWPDVRARLDARLAAF